MISGSPSVENYDISTIHIFENNGATLLLVIAPISGIDHLSTIS